MSGPGRRVALAGLVLLGGLVAVALLAGVLSPHPAGTRVGAPFLPPSGRFPLGTDDAGHDLLTQLLHAARVSLLVGGTAAVLATAVGAFVGLVAGTAGRLVDAALMRLVDMVLALPLVPLTIVTGVFLGPGLATEVAVIAGVMWARPARELRAQVLSLRSRDHVRAARMMGAGPLHVARRHLLPALTGVLVPQFVLAAKTAVLLEAALSFLGLGDPTTRSWGTMLSVAHQRSAFLTGAWTWWVLPAGVLIAATVLAFALIGYGLDADRGRAGSGSGVARRRVGAGDRKGPDPAATGPLLDLRGLTVRYASGGPAVLTGVSVRVGAGEAVGLVGPSGCGKTTLVTAALGLLPPRVEIDADARCLAGLDLATTGPREHRSVLGRLVGVVPQDAMSALNPVHRIGRQVAEAITVHEPAGGAAGRRGVRDRVVRALEEVGLPARAARAFPHELSGGMRQRAVLAIALVNDPSLLVADEPTTGLDAIRAAELVDLLSDLRARRNLAMLIISHDAAVVECLTDRVVELVAGRVQGSDAAAGARPAPGNTAAAKSPEVTT